MSHLFRPCRVCQTLTDLRCQNCNTEAYCTVNCQERDWPLHHISCAPPLTSPPHGALFVKTDTVMALAFLAGRSEYQRSEILVNTYALPSNQSRSYPVLDPALSLGDLPGHALCLKDIGGSTLKFPYAIFFRGTFRGDGSAPNGAIMRINKDISYPWAGNVIVLKFNGSRRQGYQSMGLGDLPIIAHFFGTYSR